MAGVLGADLKDVFVYYLCPFKNLRSISAGGILPQVSAPAARMDVSGQSIQALRERDVTFPGGFVVPLHACVNLFWNPLNGTFWQFQRNARLRMDRHDPQDTGTICILELSLASLVLDGSCKWTIAPKNFAASGFANYTEDYFLGNAKWDNGVPRVDWQNILNTAPFTSSEYKKQSAEIIVFKEGNDNPRISLPISFDRVNRIIIPPETILTLTKENTDFLGSLHVPVTRLENPPHYKVFYSERDLYRYEEKFGFSTQQREKTDARVWENINAASEAIIAFEKDFPHLSPKVNNYSDARDAAGYHGVLHSIRVMFWAAFLAQNLPPDERAKIIFPLMAAASLHDVKRVNDTPEETTHGAKAATAYAEAIKASFPELASSVLEAMRLHCLPNDWCAHPDQIWRILKDADSLDRGRFGRPEDAKGCKSEFLRTETLKTDAEHHNVAWMAHFFASMTEYIQLGASPCANFVNGMESALNYWIQAGERVS